MNSLRQPRRAPRHNFDRKTGVHRCSPINTCITSHMVSIYCGLEISSHYRTRLELEPANNDPHKVRSQTRENRRAPTSQQAIEQIKTLEAGRLRKVRHSLAVPYGSCGLIYPRSLRHVVRGVSRKSNTSCQCLYMFEECTDHEFRVSQDISTFVKVASCLLRGVDSVRRDF